MQEIISQTGLLFYPLLALSIVGAVLIIERLIFFICLPKIDNSESFDGLKKQLQKNATLEKSIRDELISFSLIDIKDRLERNIHLLRIIAVLSPMLGLLGTVLGMIEAFRDIAGQEGPVIPSMIADGLWSAMLTTAYGLSIALPCLLAAFIYIHIVEKRLGKFQRQLNIQSLEIEGAVL